MLREVSCLLFFITYSCRNEFTQVREAIRNQTGYCQLNGFLSFEHGEPNARKHLEEFRIVFEKTFGGDT